MSFKPSDYFENVKKIIKFTGLPSEVFLLAAQYSLDYIVRYKGYCWKSLIITDSTLKTVADTNYINVSGLTYKIETIKKLFIDTFDSEGRCYPMSDNFFFALDEITETSAKRYCKYIIDNKIYINPTPSDELTVYLIYKKTVEQITDVDDNVPLEDKFAIAFNMSLIEFCAPYGSVTSNLVSYYQMKKNEILSSIILEENKVLDAKPGESSNLESKLLNSKSNLTSTKYFNNLRKV